MGPNTVKRAGVSVAALGAAVFVGSIVAACFLDAFVVDITAVVYLLLGIYMIRGSRTAAKWALGFSLYYSAIAVALLIAVQVHPSAIRVGAASISRRDAPLVLATMLPVLVWVSSNSTVLIVHFVKTRRRAYPADAAAGACAPPLTRKSLGGMSAGRRVCIAILVLLAAIGLLVGAVALRYILRSSSVPGYATPAALEASYAAQIERLVQLASDPKLRTAAGSYGPADVQLFSSAEILEAKLETSPNSHRMVGGKNYNWQSRFWLSNAQPEPGEAVTNKYWDKLADGSRKTTLEYHRRVLDSKGDEIGVLVVFDLQRLEAVFNRAVP